ncbi:MAG: PAS domain S-box protein [Rhodocyclales bacterium]|nr:PAS domain S-box protein [Rhodocyclales bacterium]
MRKSPLKTNQKIVATFVGVLLMAALGATALAWTFRQIEEGAAVRQHTLMVIADAGELMSELKDAETAQRGYLLTGDENFLEPPEPAQASLGDRLKALRQLTLLPAAQKHLDAIAPLLEAKLAHMERAIALRRQDAPAALAQIRSGHGLHLMNSIRAEMNDFMKLETELLAQREAEFQSGMRNLLVIIVVSCLFALLLAFSFAWLMYKESQQRLKELVHLETRKLLENEEALNRQLQQANATLRASEENLAVTLNSIGDAVIATDAEARVTVINPLAEGLTGWTRAEATGRPVDEIFHIISQDTRKPAAVPVLKTLALGTIQGLANHTLLIARDGSEYAIADSCAPIRDRDGQVVGAVLVFRNVTEEYAVQQALRDSNALVRAVLHTVADGIFTLHARSGDIATVNPAAEQMFGYAAADLVGQNVSLLIPELNQEQRDRNGSLEYYAASAEARASGRGREVVGRRRDGSIFPLEMLASEMWLGGQCYITGILRDITAFKQVEQERALLRQAMEDKNTELESARFQAVQANLAKSDFLASMSHELRTPLNAILGFAQLMESGKPEPTPTQRRNLEQILKAGWYLLELINEILDLAQIESGKTMMSHEAVSLDEVLSECRTIVEQQAQRRSIDMTFPRFDSPRFVSADRTRLKQVLINLLFNAVKYNTAGGAIVVECSLLPQERVRLSVRDTGSGLAPEQLAQLFQPFNRLGREAGTEEGTGIGLVVTKRLVELMGGSIGVDSTVGVGSVFWIELGLASAPVLADYPAGHVARAPSPGLDEQPHTVLYVEDNPANLELVEQLVARRANLRLLSAADGSLGIEYARAYHPEVILMDINLPGISGIEALQILRRDPTTAHIPIIAISANAAPRDIKRALEAGFFSYLTKPIKVGEFMAALDGGLTYSKAATRATAGRATPKE